MNCSVQEPLYCSQSLSRVGFFVTPWTLQLTRILCPWRFSRQEYWSGLPCPPPGDLPSPGIEPRSPTLQADSLPSEPPGKPKNIVVGSLSLLQGGFPTQGSNQGILHCRQILYQRSYRGSPQGPLTILFFTLPQVWELDRTKQE